jgi:uncharacterized protein YaaW (UPF0174 family)
MIRIKYSEHLSDKDITCKECNDYFFENCRREASNVFSNLMLQEVTKWNLNATTTANKQVNTPLTEEILTEAMEKIEWFKKKEDMQKLLRKFLEAIEKNDIKEILFFEQWEFLKKKGQAIFFY